MYSLTFRWCIQVFRTTKGKTHPLRKPGRSPEPRHLLTPQPLWMRRLKKMANNRSAKHEAAIKAGALLCPKCCVEYQEVEIDIEFDGKVLHNVKVLRCPACEEELFTPAQHNAIIAHIRAPNKNSKSTQ